MGDELANLLEIFKRVEKDGGQATLSVSTNAGKTTIKLELTSSPSQPAPSLPSSSASGGRRCRHRGPAKKEKAKIRAALHSAQARLPWPLRLPQSLLLPPTLLLLHHLLLPIQLLEYQMVWRAGQI